MAKKHHTKTYRQQKEYKNRVERLSDYRNKLKLIPKIPKYSGTICHYVNKISRIEKQI